ncbi:tRNA (adenosine(37)-N6)-threonylcarbamoyltransferase complex ATPase subunit type 1 TsaE [Nitratifractor sp.]
MKSSPPSDDRRQTTNDDLIRIEAGLEDLPNVVEAMFDRIPAEAVISLRGDLAAGKTTLVQAIARRLGMEESVSSPTFSLQHRYGERLYHYDLYRKSFDEVAQLGLLESFDEPGWHLVEWADDALKAFCKTAGYPLWQVTILPHEERRIYRIESLDA